MNLQDLKLYAKCYVLEHKLSSDILKTAFNYIDESDEKSVLSLLGTGEMGIFMESNDLVDIKNSIDKIITYANHISEVDVWRRKSGQPFSAGYQSGVVHGMAVVTLLAAATYAAVKVYKRFLSKAARACKDLSGDKKTSCMNKYKREAQKAKVAVFEKNLSGCSKTRNPEKCKKKLKAKISKEKAKLGMT